MIELSGLPYKPKSKVFFAHIDGVKMGIVKSITCVISASGEAWLWQIEESLKGEKIIHEVGRNNIAQSWEGMKDRVGLIYSFRTHLESEVEQDGIF